MNYLVIGGNAAGMSFASKMRRNDKTAKITVLEKRSYVSFGACGLPYYIANHFDDEKKMLAKSLDQFASENIEVIINSEVIDIDCSQKKVQYKTSEEQDEYLTYDKLIISTGAKPFVPKFSATNKSKIMTLASLEDGINLKNILAENPSQKIAILGGGYIGIELLDSFIETKHKISLFEMESHILGNQFSHELSEIIQQNLAKENNLILHTSTKILDIKDSKTGYEIITDNGVDSFDLVIVCLGFRPNTDFISLEKYGNGALIVDKYYETKEKDVFAIGDCTTVTHKQLKQGVYLPLATYANKNGRQLADYLVGKKTELDTFFGSSSILINHFELATTGLTERQLINNDISFKKKLIVDKNQTSYYPGQQDIYGIIFYDPKSSVILGAQLLGKKGAAVRIHALSVAIDQQMTTQQLAYIDFAYSPPFARTWEFLNVIGTVAK